MLYATSWSRELEDLPEAPSGGCALYFSAVLLRPDGLSQLCAPRPRLLGAVRDRPKWLRSCFAARGYDAKLGPRTNKLWSTCVSRQPRPFGGARGRTLPVRGMQTEQKLARSPNCAFDTLKMERVSHFNELSTLPILGEPQFQSVGFEDFAAAGQRRCRPSPTFAKASSDVLLIGLNPSRGSSSCSNDSA